MMTAGSWRSTLSALPIRAAVSFLDVTTSPSCCWGAERCWHRDSVYSSVIAATKKKEKKMGTNLDAVSVGRKCFRQWGDQSESPPSLPPSFMTSILDLSYDYKDNHNKYIALKSFDLSWRWSLRRSYNVWLLPQCIISLNMSSVLYDVWYDKQPVKIFATAHFTLVVDILLIESGWFQLSKILFSTRVAWHSAVVCVRLN